jgi:hypothetical protein
LATRFAWKLGVAIFESSQGIHVLDRSIVILACQKAICQHLASSASGIFLRVCFGFASFIFGVVFYSRVSQCLRFLQAAVI